jgi:prophage regulatory protein
MITTILRLPEVKARTGLSRSAVYAQIAEGTFPKAIPIGKRSVGWNSLEIQSWIEARIAERKN